MTKLYCVAFMACLVSSALAEDQRNFTYVDLQPQANRALADNQGAQNPGTDLKSLPQGPQSFGDVKFYVDEKLIQLGSKVLDDLTDGVYGIELSHRAEKLHFLHGTCFGGGRNVKGTSAHVEDGTLIGEYRINFEDRTAVIFPIIYGEDVRDWFYMEDEKIPSRANVVWKGENERSKLRQAAGIRLYASVWENPWPHKRITTIDYISLKEETAAAPFLIAISTELKKAK